MPPIPTSRCCRAVQSRTKAPCEAVWVTDDVLNRALQRYLGVTGANRRAVSSAPGPLYHRQRLGRRRMTELNSFQSVGALPVWALPNAPDMMKWTWEPPKPLSFWPQLPQQDIEPGLSLGLEVPTQTCGPPQLSETPAIQRSATVKKEIAPDLLGDLDSPLGAGLQALYGTDFRTGKEFNTRFQSFVRLLQLEISHGRVRGTQIFLVYTLARRVFVRAGRALPELKGASQLPLLSAVIQGMSAAKRVNPGFVTTQPRVWKVLLKHLARQETGEKSAELFALAMDTMPARCRFQTRGAVLNVLHAYFNLWQDSTIHGKPDKRCWSEASQILGLASMWAGRVDVSCNDIKADLTLGQLESARSHLDTAQRLHEKTRRFTLKTAHLMSNDRVLIKKIAEALKNHDPRMHRSLFVIATRLLGTPRVNWTRAHYNWLQVLARLPKVNDSQFKKLLHLFPKRGRAALSHVELCDLLLLQWDSQGILKNRSRTRLYWNKIRGEDDSIALAALALAINATHHPEECAVLLWSFWDFMRIKTGDKTMIKQILSLSKHHNLSSGFLQRLAWTSNDSRVALLLHDVLVKQTGEEHNFWWPAFWDKFAMQFSHMWKYPLIDPLTIAEKMLGPNPGGRLVDSARQKNSNKQFDGNTTKPSNKHLAENKPRTPGNMSDMKTRQLSRIKSSLKLLTGAPHLTERQKIHYVASFTKFLAKAQGFLTARDLSSLTAVVTGVLDRGDHGSTERLKWYLGIIYEQLGEKACAEVGMALRLRREANWRRRRSDRIIRREDTGQRRAPTLTSKDYGGPHRGKVWPLWRYHVPKNRIRTKRLGRFKAKAGLCRPETTIAPQRPHARPDRSGHNEVQMSLATKHGRPYEGDVLGSLLKSSHQPKIDRAVSF